MTENKQTCVKENHSDLGRQVVVRVVWWYGVLLTHYSVAPRHDGVHPAVGVDTVGKHGCHDLPHQSPESRACHTNG